MATDEPTLPAPEAEDPKQRLKSKELQVRLDEKALSNIVEQVQRLSEQRIMEDGFDASLVQESPYQHQQHSTEDSPGLFHRLRAINDPEILTTPFAELLFSRADYLDFCEYHRCQIEDVQRLRMGTEYSLVIRDGALKRLWLWCTGYTKLGGQVVKGQRIPIGEVHLPNLAGCQCKYTETFESKHDIGFDVKLAGAGAGHKRSALVRTTDSFTLSPAECIVLTVAVDYELTTWVDRITKASIHLINIGEVSDSPSARLFKNFPFSPPVTHPCLQPNAFPAMKTFIQQSDLRRNKEYRSNYYDIDKVRKEEIQRERVFNYEFSLPFSLSVPEPPVVLPGAVGLKISSTVKHTMTLEHSLKGNNTYDQLLVQNPSPTWAAITGDHEH